MVQTRLQKKMKSKHWFLLMLVPLSEIKAIFYKIVEDYSNIFIFGVIFFFLAFLTIDKLTKQIATYLFILNSLDLIHLGLYDMQGFIAVKLFLTAIITHYVFRYGEIKNTT